MTPDVRILFAIGARLGMSAASVERMSMREVLGWVDYFNEAAAPANDDAVDVHSLSRAQLRTMFDHGRG